MPLIIIDRNGKHDPRPAFLCDHCGREIVGEGDHSISDRRNQSPDRLLLPQVGLPFHVDRRFKTTCCMGLDDFLQSVARVLGCAVKSRKKLTAAP